MFKEETVKFRHVTATTVMKLPEIERRKQLSTICLHNSRMLLKALETVRLMQFGAFRVMSQFFPLYTHPVAGYKLDMLPDFDEIVLVLKSVNEFRKRHDIRLSFHPDQFVIIASPFDTVVEASIRELEYQAMVAELIGAENINIHIGGVYDGKNAALQRFAERFVLLSESVRERLTLENDDLSYTVQDLLPLCSKLSIPLVYDVHHHRCNPDELSIEAATDQCIALWQKLGREPHFHISSPLGGWNSKTRRSHADFIDFGDVPEYWLHLKNFTLDVEAKAKELAIAMLMKSWQNVGKQ